MRSNAKRRFEKPTCMYALVSTYVGLAFSTSLAYSSTFTMFKSLTRVIRMAVGHLKLGSRPSVSFSFVHAFLVCGRQAFLKTSLFGAQTETYSCVGSSFNFSRLLGFVPFVTRNVVNLLL